MLNFKHSNASQTNALRGVLIGCHIRDAFSQRRMTRSNPRASVLELNASTTAPHERRTLRCFTQIVCCIAEVRQG